MTLKARSQGRDPSELNWHVQNYFSSVYCDQTVGWIKMKLGMEVGLGPDDTVLDGDPPPPKRGTAPNFRPMSIVTKRLDGSRRLLVGRY